MISFCSICVQVTGPSVTRWGFKGSKIVFLTRSTSKEEIRRFQHQNCSQLFHQLSISPKRMSKIFINKHSKPELDLSFPFFHSNDDWMNRQYCSSCKSFSLQNSSMNNKIAIDAVWRVFNGKSKKWNDLWNEVFFRAIINSNRFEKILKKWFECLAPNNSNARGEVENSWIF